MVYSRKPHPELVDYDVVTLDTKVHHELIVVKSASDDDVVQVVVDYLLQYEEVYPETGDTGVWVGLIKRLPSSTGEEDEVLSGL